MHHELDDTFFALADSTRRAIVARLGEGRATVGELGTGFDLSQQAISKHVGILVRAGLVTQERVGRTRVCSLQPRRLADARAWIGSCRAQWAGRLSRLDTHLRRKR